MRKVFLLLFSCSLIAGQAQTHDTIEMKKRMQSLLTELMKQGVFDLQDKKLPSFQVNTVDGKELSSKGLESKPTLINFWFTSCAPCIEEIPMLNRIQKSYSQKVNFIAITYQDSVEISGFLARKPFDFKQLVDARDYWDQLGIKTAPRTLVTDRNGIVRYIDKERPRDLNKFEAELRTQIEKALNH